MSPRFRTPDAPSPEWLDLHMKDYVDRFRSYEPFPFDQPTDSSSYLALHQNDYLQLSRHPEVARAKADSVARSGNGNMASTIYGGDSDDHLAFRDRLMRVLRTPDVLLATCGWTANVGLIEAIAKPGSPVYLDHQAHASLWDGARLAHASPVMVLHHDVDHLERRIRRGGPGVVCIDAYYSTDGSVADLEAYVEICERHDCVLVLDESHSFAMTGEAGGGLAVERGLAHRVHFRTSSLSKALGGHGGFIAASRHLIWYLTHRARSVIFSSNTLPSDSAAHLAALEIVGREPERAERCLRLARLLRQELHARGIPTGLSASQIVSIHFDDDHLTSRFYGLMRERGILVSVFVAPATPEGTGLARFSIHSGLEPADIVRIARATDESLRRLGVPELAQAA